MAQVAGEITHHQHLPAVFGGELGPVSANDKIGAGSHSRPGRKHKFDPLDERPVGQIDLRIATVEQLDIL